MQAVHLKHFIMSCVPPDKNTLTNLQSRFFLCSGCLRSEVVFACQISRNLSVWRDVTSPEMSIFIIKLQYYYKEA